jgi:hypothetical protein
MDFRFHGEVLHGNAVPKGRVIYREAPELARPAPGRVNYPQKLWIRLWTKIEPMP